MQKNYRANYRDLKKAFIRLSGSQRKKQDTDSFDDLVRNSEIFFRDLEKIEKTSNKKFGKYFKSPNEAAGIFLYVLYYFVRFMEPNGSSGVTKWVKGDQELDSHARLYKFYILLINLCNYLIAIRKLSASGLNMQAKVLSRSFIEYCDIGLCLLFNEEFYQAYRSSIDSEEAESKFWWNFQRPKAIEKHLQDCVKKFDDDGGHWDILKEVREKTYSLFSDFTHGHFLANFTSGYDSEFGQAEVRPALGGIIATHSSQALNRTLIYGLMFLRHVVRGIEHRTGVKLHNVDESGYYASLVLSISDKYLCENDKVFRD